VNQTNDNLRGLQTLRFGALVLAFLLGTTVALAQEAAAPTDLLSGKYEGTAKTAGAADEPVSLELKNEGGKISGRLMNGQTAIEVLEATLADGKLSLKLGPEAKDGVLTAQVDGDKISGDWLTGTTKRSVELKKVAASASTSNATLNLTGQWDGVADAQGQPFPFLLVLKIDGETVSGSSRSQLGDSTIKSGTWKDGRLIFQLESQTGVISMSAVVVDGKLSGEFDYAGQLQGKWVAIKKN
jgi:hypothetical protein